MRDTGGLLCCLPSCVFFWTRAACLSTEGRGSPAPRQSELPFRLLCRRYGAAAAYTPMLHSRLFLEDERYRAEHFTTCGADRCACSPEALMVAFLGRNPCLLYGRGASFQARSRVRLVVDPECDEGCHSGQAGVSTQAELTPLSIKA